MLLRIITVLISVTSHIVDQSGSDQIRSVRRGMILVLIVVLVFVAVGVSSSSGSGGGIGISVCTSTIHVGSDGEQKTEKFHTDSLASLYTDAKYFCARHNIYDAECELIREYHMKRCFAEATGDSGSGDGENEVVERSSDVETGDEQGKEKGKSREKDEDEEMDAEYPNGVNNHNQPVIKEKPKSSGESTRNIVDYSQSYGPVLPVTHLDKTHQLKMYVGEIPSTALKRFCGMLKLDNAQCKQVKLAYFELCQGEKYNIGDAVLEEELSSHFSGSRKVDKFSTGDNSVSSTVDGVQQDDSIVDINSRLNYHDDHPTWLKWVTSKCAEYWNFVALIIVILYLATENLP